MVLLVIGSTYLAPFGPEMVASRVTMSDTMTFLMSMLLLLIIVNPCIFFQS